MPSHPRFLPVVRAAVCEVGAVHGLPDDGCRGIALAVDEALANIIRHAYKSRYDEEIELICEASDDQIEFTFFDRGEPPGPDTICGRPLDDVSLGGRGTHLIKAIMDEVCYKRVSDRNQLTLIKHLPAAKVSVDGE